MKNNIELISVLFKYGRTTHIIFPGVGGWEILSDGWGSMGMHSWHHCMGWSSCC